MEKMKHHSGVTKNGSLQNWPKEKSRGCQETIVHMTVDTLKMFIWSINNTLIRINLANIVVIYWSKGFNILVIKHLKPKAESSLWFTGWDVTQLKWGLCGLLGGFVTQHVTQYNY